MSPTLIFLSPSRPRDLPPYGRADWRRLQPALLRRSLALSSSAALVAGLLLGLWLRSMTVTEPPERTLIMPPDHVMESPPSILPEGGPPQPKVGPDQAGIVVPTDYETPIIDEPTQVSNPVSNDLDGKVPQGSTGHTENPGNEFPERPDPTQVTVVDELPVSVHAPKPEYPDLARQAGVEGTVILQVLVNREGKVIEVILRRSSPMFDEAAEKAIRQWRFRPAILANQPVPSWVTIPVRFVLSGD